MGESKPMSEWTESELCAEHDAAAYYANASYSADTVRSAESTLTAIEREWDRREALGKRGGQS